MNIASAAGIAQYVRNRPAPTIASAWRTRSRIWTVGTGSPMVMNGGRDPHGCPENETVK